MITFLISAMLVIMAVSIMDILLRGIISRVFGVYLPHANTIALAVSGLILAVLLTVTG